MLDVFETQNSMHIYDIKLKKKLFVSINCDYKIEIALFYELC